jgi:hypothetical protein
MTPVNWRSLRFLSILLLTCTCSFAEVKPADAVKTTVCDIVNSPQQFRGKRVQVRARFWTDGNLYWVNESGSLEIGKACAWLPTEFPHSTDLIDSSAVATFIGTIVDVPTRRMGRVRSCVQLVVERESDIRDQKVLNGAVIWPQLYDRIHRTFVRPEPCLLL